MSIHDGIVTIAEDGIPVIIELDEDRVRLSASGREIGDWNSEECQITHVSDSTYTISAENEILEFTPSRPTVFAAAVNGEARRDPVQEPTGPPEPEMKTEAESEADTDMEAKAEPVPEPERATVGRPTRTDEVAEAPPPQPITMGLFYALCLSTAALAVWALISIVF
ncbi:MAG: hypothetical protein PVF87_06220 [Acidimicrobiia bacterium]